MFVHRRMSTETGAMKMEGRRVPNLFRGKEPPTTAAPKLGYRSMVSVDDVPELFASIDSKLFSFCHVSISPNYHRLTLTVDPR